MGKKRKSENHFRLSNEEITVLRAILERSSDWPHTLDSSRFDIEYEDYLEVLEALVRRSLLEREDNRYFVPILGVASLSEHDQSARHLIEQCAQVFASLRNAYKESGSIQITLTALAARTQLHVATVRHATELMRHFPVWSGRSSLLFSDESYVIPGSGFLRYKTFEAALEQIRVWRLASQPASSRQVRKPKPGTVASASLPSWERLLGKEMRALLRETSQAMDNGLRALPAMGMRAMLELALNKLGGDIGGFQRKLERLLLQSQITAAKKKIIEQLLDVGHASAHRAYFPTSKQLQDTFECVTNLIYEVEVLERKASRLSAETPKRRLAADSKKAQT